MFHSKLILTKKLIFIKKLLFSIQSYFNKKLFLSVSQCLLITQTLQQSFIIRKSFFGAMLNYLYAVHTLKFAFVLGYSYLLIELRKNFLISNVNFFAVRMGSWMAIMLFKLFKKIVYLLLPSKQILICSSRQRVMLGRNDNIFWKRQSFKMYKHVLKKVTVRGIAKNPVDHPNGGRSNTKQPFKTPWGLIAKCGK